MKLAYTATFAWDGYENVHVVADNPVTFDHKLYVACFNWIADSRKNALKALENDPETREMALEACEDFGDILYKKGALACIAEMEADCFVTVTFGMLSVGTLADALYYCKALKTFTSNPTWYNLTESDMEKPFSFRG
jgi:hypothetical protein